jgi:DNA-binding transcriptional regulator YiaG
MRADESQIQDELPQTVVRSWQNIANYIGRTPRTVQRWEHQFGMPVHRTQISGERIVFAFARELDFWLRSTPSQRAWVSQSPHLRLSHRQQQVDGFLNSWKEVARFVGISVRTVQRWEQYAGLPVHRPARKLRSPIVAIPEEVERWLNSECSTSIERSHASTASQRLSGCQKALTELAHQ